MTDTHFAVLDEKRLSPFHFRAMLTTGLGVFCDGYDISSISLVLGPALHAYGIQKMTNVEAGALTASALVGSILGALVFGLLAQKGRKRFYGVDALILGLGAVAQAFMPTLAALIACRFVLGIGVGADYVLSPTIMAEHANRADRGKAIGLGFGTMWPVGALGAALLKLLLDSFHVPPDLVWKLVLAGGAIPALGVIYLRRTMPETARYLARVAADEAEASRVMQQIGGTPAAAPSADTRPFWDVFKLHAKHIFAAALLWMVYDLVVYAGVLFGPNLIAQSLGMSPAIYQILTEAVFVIPASVLMSWFLLDNWGRKPTQVWGFAASAVVLVVFALLNLAKGVSALLRFLVFQLFNITQTGPGLVSGAGIYGVELAPTRIRSVAQSITVVGGRIGASISAFAFPQMVGSLGPLTAKFLGVAPAVANLNTLGLVASMFILAVIAVLGAVLSHVLVPETSSRSLEEINLEHAAVG
ncbi:MAG TPA: MFS transporter [Caulobacteraceae bacterium]